MRRFPGGSAPSPPAFSALSQQHGIKEEPGDFSRGGTGSRDSLRLLKTAGRSQESSSLPCHWPKAKNLGVSGAEPLRSTAWRGSLLLICMGLSLVLAGCKRGPTGGTKETRFEVDKVYERGPVTVHVRLDKTKLTIADTVLLQFEATLEPGYKIEMPRVDKVLENFGIVDWDNLGEKLDAKNHVATTYQYRLEPFLSGNYEVPAFTFEFHDVNDPGAKHELTSEPIAVEVTSLLGDQRAKLVIEDIEDVVEMSRPARLWWWLWALAAVAVAAVPIEWLLLRRRRARRVVRIFKSVHEIAYLRLRALVAANLVEQGQIKEFYERISGILRHYIEDRFNLHAPERTTEEFLAELRFTEALAPEDKKALEAFLTHCDLVKFAKHEPTTEQIQQVFDLVKDFIERTKSEERMVDVTEHVQAGHRGMGFQPMSHRQDADATKPHGQDACATSHTSSETEVA